MLNRAWITRSIRGRQFMAFEVVDLLEKMWSTTPDRWSINHIVDELQKLRFAVVVADSNSFEGIWKKRVEKRQAIDSDSEFSNQNHSLESEREREWIISGGRENEGCGMSRNFVKKLNILVIFHFKFRSSLNLSVIGLWTYVLICLNILKCGFSVFFNCLK